MDDGECDLCGEEGGYFGHFWDPEKEKNVWAHDSCGTDAGLKLA